MKDHARQLASALATILDAIEEHERHRIPAAQLRAFSLNELDAMVKRGDQLIEDPVGQSLRMGVKQIGRLLAENDFSFDEMTDVLELAADSTQTGNPGMRSYIVDKWWDGLCDKSGAILWVA
ncbi:hypothetical protein QIH87_14200 [Bradyrhizobium elkanii]|uniref:hypothetical protein n=1 Tax=Bradyrhizobium elkanii TaxID=29448 RepID=UPI001020E1E7|nr:hypothetical protein [Bradyrhizobium elkanii]MCW2112490.1 hypothetical protein [Bradyrhizobium elkanii]MCW2199153.1 hypothetical protein [Bradyrhizobium elkanii]MCW2229294.1 hypothetical protein [Bradyrhizobium elkanii]NWL38098.1 hypothetical protein [Bradyrhizobium elkanii]RYM15738.1 hypothetical protein EWH13_38515 [Bradyrhizobium elkanii]